MWHPIETAPKDGTWVILIEEEIVGFDDKSRVYPSRHSIAHFEDGGWLEMGTEPWGVKEPTHWMPLPEPPK